MRVELGILTDGIFTHQSRYIVFTCVAHGWLESCFVSNLDEPDLGSRFLFLLKLCLLLACICPPHASLVLTELRGGHLLELGCHGQCFQPSHHYSSPVSTHFRVQGE